MLRHNKQALEQVIHYVESLLLVVTCSPLTHVIAVTLFLQINELLQAQKAATKEVLLCSTVSIRALLSKVWFSFDIPLLFLLLLADGSYAETKREPQGCRRGTRTAQNSIC